MRVPDGTFLQHEAVQSPRKPVSATLRAAPSLITSADLLADARGSCLGPDAIPRSQRLSLSHTRRLHPAPCGSTWPGCRPRRASRGPAGRASAPCFLQLLTEPPSPRGSCPWSAGTEHPAGLWPRALETLQAQSSRAARASACPGWGQATAPGLAEDAAYR